ncbi:MAG: nucleoside triphosphate pyrophosphohydrolase [Anaerolineales bacterium]|jgi:tetrapyrrole methylase family protein/MazG family protein
MEETGKGIILLGLGSGRPELVTHEAWSILNSISTIYLLTTQHPVVQKLPEDLQIHSFDEIFRSEEDNSSVSEQIIQTIMELGRRPEGVVYGIPGHPLVTEATGPEIYRQAKVEGLPIRLIEGVSLIDSYFSIIEMGKISKIVIVDAQELEKKYHPLFPPNFPVLITNINSIGSLKKIKITLLTQYPPDHSVQLMKIGRTSDPIVQHVLLDKIDQSDKIELLATLFLPPLGFHTSYEEFQELISHLRSPDGCPWDREQSHQSLRRNLMEETYEVLEAIDRADVGMMQEEFGDLLLQITLHAQIASENEEFNMSDVIKGIYTKLVHRHPHVFGDEDIKDAQLVIENWEKLKAIERGEEQKKEKGLLDGISTSMPALAVADAYQRRAARVGFDWPGIEGVIEKVKEEIEEFLIAKGKNASEEEIGDILFSIVNLARWVDVDPESALRNVNEKFRRRFTFIEEEAVNRGKQLIDLTLEEMDEIWERAKKKE